MNFRLIVNLFDIFPYLLQIDYFDYVDFCLSEEFSEAFNTPEEPTTRQLTINSSIS